MRNFAPLDAKLAEREMNCRRKFREIGSRRTCTWPAQTTKMCRTQSSCKNSHTLSQGLSRNVVRIFVLQNLSTEPFFNNMTATETATEKVRYMYSTFLQVLQSHTAFYTTLSWHIYRHGRHPIFMLPDDCVSMKLKVAANKP